MEPDPNTQNTGKSCPYINVDGGCDTRKLYPDQCYLNRILSEPNLDLDQCPVRHEYDILEQDITPRIKFENTHSTGPLDLNKVPKTLNLVKIA